MSSGTFEPKCVSVLIVAFSTPNFSISIFFLTENRYCEELLFPEDVFSPILYYVYTFIDILRYTNHTKKELYQMLVTCYRLMLWQPALIIILIITECFALFNLTLQTIFS